MDALEFYCAKCDHHDAGITEVMTNVVMHTSLFFNVDGHYEYGDAEPQSGDVDHYECAICGATIHDLNGDTITERDILLQTVRYWANVKPKQKLYKTAYCPMFETHVEIKRAFKDSDGRWIFVCDTDQTPPALKDHLFREEELERFVL